MKVAFNRQNNLEALFQGINLDVTGKDGFIVLYRTAKTKNL